MKKTVTCLAMIASATAFAGAKKEAKTEREPAARAFQGYTFAGCHPQQNTYQGAQAYKNDCVVPLMEVEVPTGGMAPPGSTTKVLGCDERHFLVVTSYPMRFVCLPPGVVEL